MERTFWDSSLLVSLTLWDTPALFTPPLPLPQLRLRQFFEVVFNFFFSQITLKSSTCDLRIVYNNLKIASENNLAKLRKRGGVQKSMGNKVPWKIGWRFISL